MKKRYLLPVFILAGLVSQAWAEHCKSGGDKLYCGYEGANPGCYKIQNDYSDEGDECTTSPSAVGCESCAVKVPACEADGMLFTGVDETPLNASPWGKNENCKTLGGTQIGGKEDCGAYYCKWSSSSCDKVAPDDCSSTSGDCTPTTTCEEAIENCARNSPNNTVYSNNACTTVAIEGENCNAWCSWNSGSCTKITPDDCSSPDSDPACAPTTTCEEAIANCEAYSPSGTAYNNANCSTSPILPGTSFAGLTVLVSNGNLHVSSLKGANVSLFDMQGKQVFSTKLAAGYKEIALKNHRMGIYYAVVQSGSAKQTVKVIVK